MGPKIATCSYCGSRAALVFDAGRHELTCRACGAPLHEMKAMPQDPDRKAKKTKRAPVTVVGQRRSEAPDYDRREWRDWPAKRRPKRRKPLARRMLEEIWDVVEDIFD